MGKVTWRDAEPDDPMFKEGPQSYSPHWARTFLTPTKPSQAKRMDTKPSNASTSSSRKT